MAAKNKVVKHKELKQRRLGYLLDQLEELLLSRPCDCNRRRAELAQKKERMARRKRGR